MSVLACPHCGSALTALEVETTPLRCPVCGAMLSLPSSAEALPIREAIVREEDDSATRPVARERMAPVIAQAIADHQAAREAPRDEATQALPTSASPLAGQSAAPDARDVTQALPPNALPPEPPTRHSLAGALRAVSVALVALVLLAVVAVAALVANGVIGGAPSVASVPTATTTVTPTPAGNVFGASGLYQVAYQRGWLVTQRNTPPQSYYALLNAPSGGASVNIAAQLAAGAPDLVTLDEQFLQALAQQGTTPSRVSAPVSVTVGGQEWTQLTADVTLRVASGRPTLYAHAVALSTRRGSYVYTIVYLTPSSDPAAASAAFATANAAYFQPLLASFTFLS